LMVFNQCDNIYSSLYLAARLASLYTARVQGYPCNSVLTMLQVKHLIVSLPQKLSPKLTPTSRYPKKDSRRSAINQSILISTLENRIRKWHLWAVDWVELQLWDIVQKHEGKTFCIEYKNKG
jgi:hypothetical protein